MNTSRAGTTITVAFLMFTTVVPRAAFAFFSCESSVNTSVRTFTRRDAIPVHNGPVEPARQTIALTYNYHRRHSSSTKSVVIRQMSSSSTISLSDCPSLTLRDGSLHPAVGFGTYKVGYTPPSASSAAVSGVAPSSSTERTAQECVCDALNVGYRFLECAEFYGNEDQVGKAIQQCGIPRNELFLCSKVWTTTIEQGPQAIRNQLEQSLRDLQTDYVDLYLVHWPVPNHHVVAYQTLLELKAEGKIRGVGVSNYAWEDYVELKDAGITDLPLVNQIEINPFLYRRSTIAKFQSEGVILQSYRSLRDGKAFDHPLLVQLSQSKSKTAAQILGRWCVQKGFVYIPKSVRKERMIENGQVFDFELTPTEMEQLDHLTTQEALQAFQSLYRKCVNRDTSKDGTFDGVKMDITID